MKLKQAIPFRNQPRIRLALGLIIAIVLTLLVFGRQQGWLNSPPASQQNIECANLGTGCSFTLRQQDYRVVWQNGVLRIKGKATGVQADWPPSPLNWLERDANSDWTRPAKPRDAAPFVLTVMIDRHRVAIHTQLR